MSQTVLYIDCFSGIAGDMFLGAMLDLGLPRERLDAELARLDLPDWHLHVARARRHAISGVDVQVHSHDHGHDHSHSHSHDHDHESDVGHTHDHGHIHRTWRDIRGLITGSGIAGEALALRIFLRLAEAEARLHDTDIDSIHFHEVGGVDAIIDICGAAIALDWLAPNRVLCAPVPVPRGFVTCDHGHMPLPAPATMQLLVGAEVRQVESEGEWVTPTGAAILAEIVDSWESIPSMRVDAIGYGVGDRDPADRANLLRVVRGSVDSEETSLDRVIQANIDDMSAELFGHVAELLLEEGALDVWMTPVLMKKGRPGTQLSVLSTPAALQTLITVITRESTTLGVRVSAVERFKLARAMETVETAWGPVRVKVARDGQEIVNVAPEFEDVRAIARASGVPAKDVLSAVWANVAKGR